MNIIMVCESATVTGGAEKVAIQEAIELAKRGLRVGYIAAGTESDQAMADAGVEILLLDTTSFFEEPQKGAKLQKLFWNASIEPEVFRFLSGFEPEKTILHLHTFRLKLSGVVAHIAQKLGFSTFVHCHDYSPICPTSLLYDHRTQSNCERKPMSWSCISCECQNHSWKYKLPKLTSHFWNQTIWKINHKSKGFIHISQLEEETIATRGGKQGPSFHVPPIGDAFTGPRIHAEENRSFLFIGRLTPEKGIEEFLGAAELAGVNPVVVGDGPLGKSLRQRFPSVRFTGWLNKDEIAEELKQARALVVPSVWRETLGLSVIDAMQMGIPCIVSQFVGAKEYIEDGENGTIFYDNLPSSLSSYSDDKFVQRLSEGAYRTFDEQPPSIERHVDRLIEIYEGSLSK